MKNRLRAVISKNISYYRKEKNWSVERLARRMLIDPGVVREVEKGNRGMTLETLEDYSKALGVSVVFLVADRGE